MSGFIRKVLVRLFEEPRPVRRAMLAIVRTLKLGSYELRVRLGAVERPHYAYCVYHAAELGKRLGYPRISVVEFGVAGGRGLMCLEQHAREASRKFGIEIEVYGFDTGEGLPPPADYRDLPYHWQQGFFRMDVDRLKRELVDAKLVLGNLSETAPSFLAKHHPAPVGAIAFDLDFHSSTVDALRLFDSGGENFLPRVFCYLDDIIGGEVELYNDFTGVRLAFEEFNRDHADVKISPAYQLLGRLAPQAWHHQIRICHFYKHERYNTFVGESNQQLSIG